MLSKVIEILAVLFASATGIMSIIAWLNDCKQDAIYLIVLCLTTYTIFLH